MAFGLRPPCRPSPCMPFFRYLPSLTQPAAEAATPLDHACCSVDFGSDLRAYSLRERTATERTRAVLDLSRILVPVYRRSDAILYPVLMHICTYAHGSGCPCPCPSLTRGQIPPLPHLYECLAQKHHLSSDLFHSQVLHLVPLLLVTATLSRSNVNLPRRLVLVCLTLFRDSWSRPS